MVALFARNGFPKRNSFRFRDRSLFLNLVRDLVGDQSLFGHSLFFNHLIGPNELLTADWTEYGVYAGNKDGKLCYSRSL